MFVPCLGPDFVRESIERQKLSAAKKSSIYEPLYLAFFQRPADAEVEQRFKATLTKWVKNLTFVTCRDPTMPEPWQACVWAPNPNFSFNNTTIVDLLLQLSRARHDCCLQYFKPIKGFKMPEIPLLYTYAGILTHEYETWPTVRANVPILLDANLFFRDCEEDLCLALEVGFIRRIVDSLQTLIVSAKSDPAALPKLQDGVRQLRQLIPDPTLPSSRTFIWRTKAGLAFAKELYENKELTIKLNSVFLHLPLSDQERRERLPEWPAHIYLKRPVYPLVGHDGLTFKDELDAVNASADASADANEEHTQSDSDHDDEGFEEPPTNLLPTSF